MASEKLLYNCYSLTRRAPSHRTFRAIVTMSAPVPPPPRPEVIPARAVVTGGSLDGIVNSAQLRSAALVLAQATTSTAAAQPPKPMSASDAASAPYAVSVRGLSRSGIDGRPAEPPAEPAVPLGASGPASKRRIPAPPVSDPPPPPPSTSSTKDRDASSEVGSLNANPELHPDPAVVVTVAAAGSPRSGGRQRPRTAGASHRGRREPVPPLTLPISTAAKTNGDPVTSNSRPGSARKSRRPATAGRRRLTAAAVDVVAAIVAETLRNEDSRRDQQRTPRPRSARTARPGGTKRGPPTTPSGPQDPPQQSQQQSLQPNPKPPRHLSKPNPDEALRWRERREKRDRRREKQESARRRREDNLIKRAKSAKTIRKCAPNSLYTSN
jgi:hypothetical protein